MTIASKMSQQATSATDACAAKQQANKLTPRQAFDLLNTSGREALASLQSNDEAATQVPAWFDEVRFVEAKQALKKLFLGVQFSSFTGLLLILQLPDGLEPLLSTGNSKDVPSLFKRYLNTIVLVRSWYEDDVFDPSTTGYKSIRKVRSMHKRVQKIMNEKFTVADNYGKQRMWMTNFDMSITQFAFIGLAMLYPHKCGIGFASKHELELINYYWRVLGYLMGIDDAYNLCQFDSYGDIVEFNKIVMKEAFVDVFDKEPCDKGLVMTQAITVALKYFMPLLTFNNLAHWWSDSFEFNGYKPLPQTRREKVLYSMMKLSMNKLMKSERIFLPLSTWAHHKSFEIKLKKRDKVYEKLKKKYQDNQEYSFFSDRIDYFAKSTVNGCPVFGDKVYDNGISNEFVTLKNKSDGTSESETKNLGVCPFSSSTVDKKQSINTEAYSDQTTHPTIGAIEVAA